jgi:hypothetical protein
MQWSNAENLGTSLLTSPEFNGLGYDNAASLGLIPRQDFSGGITCLGPITKQGGRYLQTLLVPGPPGSVDPFVCQHGYDPRRRQRGKARLVGDLDDPLALVITQGMSRCDSHGMPPSIPMLQAFE